MCVCMCVCVGGGGGGSRQFKGGTGAVKILLTRCL